MPLFDRIIDGLFGKHLARLRGHVVFADELPLRVERSLAGDIDRIAHLHGL